MCKNEGISILAKTPVVGVDTFKSNGALFSSVSYKFIVSIFLGVFNFQNVSLR
jgi:hypothetical protein